MQRYAVKDEYIYQSHVCRPFTFSPTIDMCDTTIFSPFIFLTKTADAVELKPFNEGANVQANTNGEEIYKYVLCTKYEID